MIEVDVHQQLRAFLREQGEPPWPHHLTLARLVARALRLHRHALLQVGAAPAYQGRYRLSYLVPLLLSPQPAVLVVPTEIQQRFLHIDLPRLSEWLGTNKPVQVGDAWPNPGFNGLLLTSPNAWLSDFFQVTGKFPAGLMTVIDGVDDLPEWVRQQLTVSLAASAWADLTLAYPLHTDLIRDARIQLTHLIFQHPANPYECTLLDQPEQDVLLKLQQDLQPWGLENSPQAWQVFWQQLSHWRQTIDTSSPEYSPHSAPLGWVEIQRSLGHFSLHLAPVTIDQILQPLWERQSVVLLGGTVDPDSYAPHFRQQLGLAEATCLKFLPDRQTEAIRLYLPERMPMPNTPEFPAALLQQIYQFLHLPSPSPPTNNLAHKPIVLIVEDLPLRAQVAAALAAEFGSRVQVETTRLEANGILVTGWHYWQHHQHLLPGVKLLGIATLPIPSLEDPRVAGQVAHYKRLRQDWFRQYLLPTAISQLERAVAPVRENAGLVAIWDPRLVYRNYGQQILSALSPYLRTKYLDRGVAGWAEPAYPELE